MSWGCRHLTVRYGAVTALEDVSVELPESRITMLVGGDGAGKTTLLAALAGTRRVTSGEVARPGRARIGAMPATGAAWSALTVAENLAFAARVHGLPPTAATERIENLLEVTALGPARDRRADRLSGGMRQKLGLAMAVLHRPDLLLLDEPTTGVDPVSRAELWRSIHAVADEGAAVAVATTYLEETEHADRVVLLEDGGVRATGAPGAVAEAIPEAHLPVRTGSPTGDAPVRLEARGLTRRFGATTAVDDVDLVVREGEIVGLVGPNGAGKTTLVRMLLGLLAPTAGHARLLGGPPSREARARVGHVPQGLGLYRALTVTENLEFVAAAYGVTGDLGGLLEESGLAPVADRRLSTLPLGVQRRVAYAGAALHQPVVLVLDEPTSGVDPVGRVRLWRRIHAAADAGTAVLVTTHHLAEVERCDRMVLLVDGRVVVDTSPRELRGGGTLEERFAELTA